MRVRLAGAAGSGVARAGFGLAAVGGREGACGLESAGWLAGAGASIIEACINRTVVRAGSIGLGLLSRGNIAPLLWVYFLSHCTILFVLFLVNAKTAGRVT